MRARVWVVVAMAAGCGRSVPHGDDPAGDAGSCPTMPIEVRCGDIAVTVEPFADGVVRLHYGEAGIAPTPSWAVVVAAPGVPATLATAPATLCTPAMTVEVDATCRVRATLADGTIAIDDAVPFALGGEATLERDAHGDRVYGLGERVGGLDRRGHTWTFWNTDAYDPAFGGWHPDQDPLYQSIPFAVHVAGSTAFGVFTDATRRMTMALGGPRDRIAVTGARAIEQYVIAGPRMADVVDRYTQLTGRPARPPRWALGFHQSRWGYGSAAEVEAVAARYRDLALPADAIWLDIQHMRGFRSFTFEPSAFGDPRGMTGRLAARGFRTIAIEDPGIKVDPGWDVYETGRPHFLAYTGNAWPGASMWPDFSSAAARTWWAGQVGGVLDQGVAGIWLDVNEPTTFPEGGGGTTIPDDVAADGDGTPTTMAALHNAYALFQARATFDAIAARGTRPFVLSRAGYAGIQRYAATWTGDTPSTWYGLQQTLPMMLGLGISGMPFVGSDIGGYSGHATPELYARWLALGSISPFARAHVTSGVPGQEPWQFGAEVLVASRDFLGERYRLLPYLYSLADEAARTGAPLLRPLVWEFPDDPAVADLADEAMLGPWILVAPAVAPGATTRDVYLPAGRWFDYASGAILEGPTTITVPLRLAALPMFVRAGAILPRATTVGVNADSPSDLVVDVYPGATTSRFTIYEDDGESLAGSAARTEVVLEPRSDGAHVTLTRTGALATARGLSVRVHRVDGTVAGVESGGASIAYAYDAGDRTLAVAVPDAPAVDLAFHYDPAISEPAPLVAVPFEIRVPANTPADPPIHIASSATGWTHVPLTWVAPGVARGTLTAPRGQWIDYKVTRGAWDTVEKLDDCAEAPNRTRIASAATRADTVATWRDRCGN